MAQKTGAPKAQEKAEQEQANAQLQNKEILNGEQQTQAHADAATALAAIIKR
ncbi:hypothetical protein LW953_17635 [Erwinia amylovora]|uniref:hypothetical protein n=1 Tax=Erwinia amylovora TaxID=552 RepID=UPI0020BEF745|nr:hypothetical protein [Erwinia amylovora]MCK8306088.1 hypothetical protein [Erwinia amylovora]